MGLQVGIRIMNLRSRRIQEWGSCGLRRAWREARAGLLILGGLLLGGTTQGAEVNDAFANRTPLSGAPLVINASSAGATSEVGEPMHANTSRGYSLWWSWTAAAREAVSLDTTGTAFTAALAVYTGEELPTLTPVVYNIPYDTRPAVAFLSEPGVTYQIAVAVYSGTAGNVVLRLGTQPAPTNDAFADRPGLFGATNIITGSSVACTKEPGEPAHAGYAGGSSVWWSWTAPADGRVIVETSGSSIRTLLGVYTGSTATNLTPVVQSIAPVAGATNRVMFWARAGVDYAIALDQYNTYAGMFRLDLRQPAGAPEFLSEPQSLLVGRADPAAMSVLTAGAEPITYEWWFQGVLQTGATNATLAIPSALEEQAGNYQLVARNTFGAITSAPVTLGIMTNTVAFASGNQSVLEGDRLTVSFSRTGFTNALQVRYAIAGTAVAGVDYVNLSGFVAFAAGQTSAAILLRTLDDSVEEPSRVVRLSLLPDGHYSIGEAGTVELTRVEDDPNVRVTVTDDLVREVDENPGAFVLRRSGSLDQPLTAVYTTSGSARPGVDYEALPGTASFAAGVNEVVLPVRPLPSRTAADRSIVVDVLPDAAYQLRPPSRASITLLANRAPTVTLTAPEPWQGIAEGQPVTLRAVASDPDGEVGQVEFLDGEKRLGVVAAAPFRWTATLSRGVHLLRARAMDIRGVTGESAPVSVFVSAAADAVQVRPYGAASPASSVSGNGDSTGAVISRDGVAVAFVSTATDLLPQGSLAAPVEGAVQVYVSEVVAGTTTLVSANGSAVPGGGDSVAPVFSGNGAHLVFESMADKLAAYDLNASSDVFLLDRGTRSLRLISTRMGVTDVAADGASGNATISFDGTRVAFQSTASNLVAGDTNGAMDVFVRDVVAGRTERVSVALDGGAANAASESPVISDDGRRVAFLSWATNLVDVPSGLAIDVLVRDLESSVTWSAGRDVPGLLMGMGNTNAARYRCYNPSLSADGRRVAFKAAATNYTGPVLVLHHDLDTHTTVLVATNGSMPLNLLNDASCSALSSDGQLLAYESTNRVFLFDARTGGSVCASVDPGGVPPASGRAWSPVLSADGRFLAFHSDAPGIVADVQADSACTYLRDLGAGTTVLASVDAVGGAASFLDNFPPSLSGDGSLVAFSSPNPGLVAQDSNGRADAFLRIGGTNRLLSVRGPGRATPMLPMEETPGRERCSADGRFVTFTSLSDAWTPGDTNKLWDVFRLDRASGECVLVSVNTNGVSAKGASRSPVMSADGQVIAFLSGASDLAPNDSNKNDDVFVRDLAAGVTVLVSSNRIGMAPSSGVVSAPSLSADGRWVGFVSTADDLVAGSNPGADMFLRHWQSGGLIRFTNLSSRVPMLPLWTGNSSNAIYLGRATTGTPTGTNCVVTDLSTRSNLWMGPVLSRPHVTSDGRFVAFRMATNKNPAVVLDCRTGRLLVGVTNAPTDLYLPDMSVSDVVLSDDGRRMAFESVLNLDAARDTGAMIDVYVLDVAIGTPRLASVDYRGVVAGNGPSRGAVLSPDGRFLAFRSRASNLVPGRVTGENLYVRDLDVGKVWLVAGLNRGPGIGMKAGLVSMVPGDVNLVFRSLAADPLLDTSGAPRPVMTFALQANPDQDLDGDGMEDGWEMRVFGDLQSDALSDRDADGLTDLQEFWAGTDPLRAESRLMIAFIQRSAEGRVRVEWPAVAGRHYRVEASDTLEPGGWNVVAGDVAPAGLLGSFEQDEPEAVRRFYRVMVIP
jgi:Tol biopolymer transport system component